jgi:hypothetical protein
MGCAIIEFDLLPQRLVPADQRGRRKPQEPERIRHAPCLPGLDDRLPDGDVEASFEDAGVDDA